MSVSDPGACLFVIVDDKNNMYLDSLGLSFDRNIALVYVHVNSPGAAQPLRIFMVYRGPTSDIMTRINTCFKSNL
jgi:hypothetical protein